MLASRYTVALFQGKGKTICKAKLKWQAFEAESKCSIHLADKSGHGLVYLAPVSHKQYTCRSNEPLLNATGNSIWGYIYAQASNGLHSPTPSLCHVCLCHCCQRILLVYMAESISTRHIL